MAAIELLGQLCLAAVEAGSGSPPARPPNPPNPPSPPGNPSPSPLAPPPSLDVPLIVRNMALIVGCIAVFSIGLAALCTCCFKLINRGARPITSTVTPSAGGYLGPQTVTSSQSPWTALDETPQQISRQKSKGLSGQSPRL